MQNRAREHVRHGFDATKRRERLLHELLEDFRAHCHTSAMPILDRIYTRLRPMYTQLHDYNEKPTADGRYVTKLEAILAPGVEYDGLRRTFFTPPHVGPDHGGGYLRDTRLDAGSRT